MLHTEVSIQTVLTTTPPSALISLRCSQAHTNISAQGSIGLFITSRLLTLWAARVFVIAGTIMCVLTSSDLNLLCYYALNNVFLPISTACFSTSTADIFTLSHTKKKSCLYGLTVVDFLKSKSSMAHVYCWNQENKASLSRTHSASTPSHTHTHTHTHTHRFLRHGNKGNKHRFSPSLRRLHSH